MNNEAGKLRAEIAALSDLKTRRRYPGRLRRRLVAYARAQAALGESQAMVAAGLGLSQSALSRMVRTYEDAPLDAGFVEISIAPQPAKRAPGFTVRGPCGMQVDGLSVDDVAALFARLSCSV